MAVCVPSLAETPGSHSADFSPGDFPLNDAIIIRGARTHNLKNISCEIPHGRLTVISGVSGSGKSSLAFDTDRKSTRLNSSHLGISYAVFCLKKKKKKRIEYTSLSLSFNHNTQDYLVITV